MQHLVEVAVLTLLGSLLVFGQAITIPANWLGTWTLSPEESKFGEVWGPGAPARLTVTGQKLKIAAVGGHMNIAGDTITSELGTVHDEFDLDLKTGQIVVPPGPAPSFQFRRINEATFDLIISVNDTKLGNHLGKNRFTFSGDGTTLTETKTHTEREVTPAGTDQTNGRAIRTSTSVLVFHKVLHSK